MAESVLSSERNIRFSERTVDEQGRPRARTTLEQSTSIAPFTITCGVYGWMLYPQFLPAEPGVLAQFHAMKDDLAFGASGSRGTASLRLILVAGETALSVVLLTGAGLLLLSFLRIREVDTGFKTGSLTTFRLALPPTRYKNAHTISNFHDRFLEEANRIPGVQSVGSVSILPLSGPIAAADFTIQGAAPVTAKVKPSANYPIADAGYFQAMGIPILRGRGFLVSDTISSKQVAVVSQSLVSRYFPSAEPLGATIVMEDNAGVSRQLEIVGVAGNTREASLEETPVRMVHVALPQMTRTGVRFVANNMFWVVRVSGSLDPSAAFRAAFTRIDGYIAVAPSAMKQYVSRAVARRDFLPRNRALFSN